MESLKSLIKEAIMELGGVVMIQPRWLTTKQASLYSGLSEKTLRRLAQEGEIYAVQSPQGGKLLFDRESIDAYFLRHKGKAQILVNQILGGAR